jgi:hypothetical protein
MPGQLLRGPEVYPTAAEQRQVGMPQRVEVG